MEEKEYEMKEQEIANAALREVIALQRDADLTSTTKRYGDTLNMCFPGYLLKALTCQLISIRSRNVFAVYEVPNNLKAKLILPLLLFMAKSVICRLTAA